MRVLQVNNVAEILGGTLQCSHSIVQALPNARHSIFCLSGSPSPECKRAFQRHRFGWGTNLQGEVDAFRPDIVIYHNIAQIRLPRVDPAMALTVFYLHSGSAQSAAAADHCRLRFCVSEYLASQVGWKKSDVLYQPVWMPKEGPPRQAGSVVRIATQRLAWWDRAELQQFIENLPPMSVHLVTKMAEAQGLAAHYHTPTMAAKEMLYSAEFALLTGKNETFGRVVREAQLAGCVPIVSRGSGGPEEVVNKWGGMKVASNAEAAEMVRFHTGKGLQCSAHEHPGLCTLGMWREQFIQRVAAAPTGAAT